MITNLPADFVAAMESRTRQPIQLLTFTLNSGEIYYLSDAPVGTLQGLDNEYLPWVESWGTLKDNTNITNLYDGNSLEIRQGTISIIVSPTTRDFVKKLFNSGVENTEVELHQFFIGMTSAPVLIDIMACQDPIKHTEATMMLSIDLVSVIMRTNAPLWPTVAGLADQPIVMGKASGLVLKDEQTSRVTSTADDITFDYLGPLFIENGLGFVQPAVGETEYVYIDSELIGYTDINVSTITISERAATPPLPATQTPTTARPHLRGALVVPYGAVYDYIICSGPVESVENLIADGEDYTNDVTFFPNQHPVVARFNGRPPWLSAIEGAEGPDIEFDPVTQEFKGTGATALSSNNATTETLSGKDNINGSGSATMYMSDTVAGGPGSYNYYALSVAEVGTDAFDYTKWKKYAISTLGTARFYARTLNGASPAAGALTTTTWTFNRALSSYGDFTSLDLSWSFGSSYKMIGCEAKVTLQLVLGSQVSNLASWTIDNYDQTWPNNNVTSPWDNQSGTTNIGSGSMTWADLQTAKVQLICEVIRAREDGWSPSPDRVEVNMTSLTWKVNYFVQAGSDKTPWQYVYSTFGVNSPQLGAIESARVGVKYSSTVGAGTQVYIEYFVNGATTDSTTIYSNTGEKTVWLKNLGAPTWAQISAMTAGIRHSIRGLDNEGAVRSVNTQFMDVLWEITYQPGAIETPDEERVIYAEQLTCDVTGHMGADPTPPEALRHLIEYHSDAAGYIDEGDFDAAHTEYFNAGYFLNGVLAAGTDLHTALKTVLREGLCRFIFNQGKIKLHTYFEESSSDVDFIVSEDDRALRSSVVANQPTNTIRNSIKILYDKDYTEGTFNGEVEVNDPVSIAKYLSQSYERSLELVDSESVAQLHANRILEVLGTPASILSFKMYMAGYPLEKGDRIQVASYVDDRFYNVGNVLTVSRTFGKGKVQQMNEFEISFANPVSYAHLELSEEVVFNDTQWSAIKGIIFPVESVVFDDNIVEYSKEYSMVDNLRLTENIYTDLEAPDGYGASGYGVFGYGI